MSNRNLVIAIMAVLVIIIAVLATIILVQRAEDNATVTPPLIPAPTL